MQALPMVNRVSVRRGLLELSEPELLAWLSARGQPALRARQLRRWVVGGRATAFAQMTDLPQALREQLDAEFAPFGTAIERHLRSSDGTHKLLLRLGDGEHVECVLMQESDRRTVCVSTQVGCGMGCVFCASGLGGVVRNLTAAEILEQLLHGRNLVAETERVTHVVVMGMGEPLANYDATLGAVHRIHHDLGLSARHLTLSTVGIVPGIRRLAAEPLPVGLAVSLHAANDQLRDELVPINRRYPIQMLVESCEAYLADKGRRLSLEWALIAGVNDRMSDATELSVLAKRLGAHVNLIPLNPTPGYPTRGTAPAGVRAFRDRLLDLGVNVTVRQTRGVDINAACGQLAALSNS
jgi:23S rRNA (adenine2503-C2)-methyltransferase